MATILNQHPIEYDTGLKEESNKRDEDPRVRLLRKRGMRTGGKRFETNYHLIISMRNYKHSTRHRSK